MSYIVRVSDRGRVLASFELKTFDLAIQRYRECKVEWPGMDLGVHNEDKYDAEWVDDRWVVFDGMTEQEKEALDGVSDL